MAEVLKSHLGKMMRKSSGIIILLACIFVFTGYFSKSQSKNNSSLKSSVWWDEHNTYPGDGSTGMTPSNNEGTKEHKDKNSWESDPWREPDSWQWNDQWQPNNPKGMGRNQMDPRYPSGYHYENRGLRHQTEKQTNGYGKWPPWFHEDESPFATPLSQPGMRKNAFLDDTGPWQSEQGASVGRSRGKNLNNWDRPFDRNQQREPTWWKNENVEKEKFPDFAENLRHRMTTTGVILDTQRNEAHRTQPSGRWKGNADTFDENREGMFNSFLNWNNQQRMTVKPSNQEDLAKNNTDLNQKDLSDASANTGNPSGRRKQNIQTNWNQGNQFGNPLDNFDPNTRNTNTKNNANQDGTARSKVPSQPSHGGPWDVGDQKRFHDSYRDSDGYGYQKESDRNFLRRQGEVEGGSKENLWRDRDGSYGSYDPRGQRAGDEIYNRYENDHGGRPVPDSNRYGYKPFENHGQSREPFNDRTNDFVPSDHVLSRSGYYKETKSNPHDPYGMRGLSKDGYQKENDKDDGYDPYASLGLSRKDSRKESEDDQYDPYEMLGLSKGSKQEIKPMIDDNKPNSFRCPVRNTNEHSFPGKHKETSEGEGNQTNRDQISQEIRVPRRETIRNKENDKIFHRLKQARLHAKRVVVNGRTVPKKVYDMAPEIFDNLPGGFLKDTRNACWYTNDTMRLRCLPYFYLAGFSNSGHADLWDKIQSHPQVLFTSKNSHFWTRHRNDKGAFETFTTRGLQSELPGPFAFQQLGNKVIGDGSDSTIREENLQGVNDVKADGSDLEPTFLTADLIHAVQPNAKIIVVLRDPIERAFAAFTSHHSHRKLMEFSSMVLPTVRQFNVCVKKSKERACAYKSDSIISLRAGLYSVFLRDWLTVFPRDQVKVVQLDDWECDCIGTLSGIYEFLGLYELPRTMMEGICTMTNKNLHREENQKQSILRNAQVTLQKFYKPYLEDLRYILQDPSFGWCYTVFPGVGVK